LFFYDSFSFGVHKILGFCWRRGACKTTGAPVALEVALALHYITNWAALGTDRNRKTEHSIPCIKYTPCVFRCMSRLLALSFAFWSLAPRKTSRKIPQKTGKKEQKKFCASWEAVRDLCIFKSVSSKYLLFIFIFTSDAS